MAAWRLGGCADCLVPEWPLSWLGGCAIGWLSRCPIAEWLPGGWAVELLTAVGLPASPLRKHPHEFWGGNLPDLRGCLRLLAARPRWVPARRAD